jgi:hypothetical protein
VVRHFAALLSLVVLCNSSDALARNPRDAFSEFAGIPQSVVTQAVQAGSRKSPDAEITCVGHLRPGGSSKSALIEQGIPTSDGGVAPERASCWIQMTQSIVLTALTGAQTGPYGVDGLTLGSKVAFGSPAYREYGAFPVKSLKGLSGVQRRLATERGVVGSRRGSQSCTLRTGPSPMSIAIRSPRIGPRMKSPTTFNVIHASLARSLR